MNVVFVARPAPAKRSPAAASGGYPAHQLGVADPLLGRSGGR